RLAQKEKKHFERQQKIQNKIEQTKARAGKLGRKKSEKNSSSSDGNLDEQNSASENFSEKK
ncbi:MAG: hypothetical protein K2F89_00965, partial [Treponemataceae bacterium]|nr:hypothetical protein [Treponemataceae bacterium]